ncbi:hypothetical protein ABEB36_010203 [Hypothenemus hampei]|uniref:Uncharacterized protein n=1 Tax=Hypothenemus hampei TaxID=57062 RepID=A0ABD1EIW7_HYPHA
MKGKSIVTLLLLLVILLPLINAFLLSLIHNKENPPINSELVEESRKKKKKKQNNYILGIVAGAILCKMILLPLAFKAMAVMSSVSVLLSAMGLIISSIVGYTKLATQTEEEPFVKLVHVNDIWAKKDAGNYDYLQLDKEEQPTIPIEKIQYTVH